MPTNAQNREFNDRQRRASGTFSCADPQVSFLYQLLRDHVTPGVMERIVREVELEPQPITYTNGWLAKYADHLAARLRAAGGGYL